MYDIKRLATQKGFTPNKQWLCPFNFEQEVNQGLQGKTVAIHDVTLRDGEQTCGVAFNIADRVRIAQALDELGVDRIEAGMPVISQENRDGIREIVKCGLNAEISALVRTEKLDIDYAQDCGVTTVIVEHCINPYLTGPGYGLEPQEVIARCIAAVSYAKEIGLKAVFMGWDLTRIDDLDYLRELYLNLARECPPDSLVLVDTFGTALPRSAGFLVTKVREWLPDTRIEYHNHNEFGLANACALEAVAAGAEVLHTAINGLGERTGNAATEEVVAMLEMLAGVDTAIDMEKLMDISILVENISGRAVPANKPVVGRGLFDVETGVAADLIRKMEHQGFDMAVTPFTPKTVGQPPGKLVLGKNSGRASVQYYLEQYGLSASQEQIDDIVAQVKTEGRLQRALLSDAQFLAISNRVLGQ